VGDDAVGLGTIVVVAEETVGAADVVVTTAGGGGAGVRLQPAKMMVKRIKTTSVNRF
jgi:hypothetical protein